MLLSPYFIYDSNDNINGGSINPINPIKSSITSEINKTLGHTPEGSECSPHIKHNKGVCSSSESIEIMKQWLNIDINDPKKIVELAKEKTDCNSESCLYKKMNLSPEDLKERFNPQGPYNSTNWLNNTNIDQVLEKYTYKFPHFKCVQYQMIDFKKMNTELNNVNWQDLLNKKVESFACIVNTDVSTGPGQHWVALFIDFQQFTVEYFDSAGQDPQPEILEFLIETSSELSNLSKKKWKDICVTKLQHQLENTECGVYSLFYIICRLHDIPYRFFEHTRVPDEEMEAFRKSLYRHS